MSAPLTRIDTRALYEALDQRRRIQGLTWKAVAEQIGHPAITAGMLAQTAKGGRVGVIQFMAYVQWLEEPAESFLVRPRGAELPDLMGQVSNLLTAQAELAPPKAAALEQIVREAYERLRAG